MHKRRYIHLPYIKRILFFWIAGFIFGSTLGVFFLPQYKEQYLYIQKQLYTSILGMNPKDLSYFIFCIFDQVKQMIMIILITFTIFLEIYGKILFMWRGIVTGFLFSAAVKCFGGTGWILFLVSWFPQGIFYALAFIIQFAICYKMREENKSGNLKVKGDLAKWGFIFLLCFISILIGGYLECGINLSLLKKILERCNKIWD